MLTLWDKAIETPPYPTFSLKKAKGGEETFRLIEEDGLPPRTLLVSAKKGEILRSADMRYLADTDQNLNFRMHVFELCARSEHEQEMQLRYCKSNILYFVNVFGFTFDPRLSGTKNVPFVTYPFQDRLFSWWLDRIKFKDDSLTEKSREMGLTWCAVSKVCWLTLFHEDMITYMLSMKEDDVDDKTINSLLGKVRYLINNLPEWMRGGWREGSVEIDKKMMIKIPHTKSMTNGELTQGTGGRGGRALTADFDEFAHVEDSEAAIEASSSLADSCNFMSTVKGTSNAFAKMARAPGVHKMRLHYSLHPLKNHQWKVKERAKPKYTEAIWAQEQEISYSRSKQGRVFPEFITETFDHDSNTKKRWSHAQEGADYEYDSRYNVYLGMDLGFRDPTFIVFCQIKPAPLEYIEYTRETLVVFREMEKSNWLVNQWTDWLLEEQKIHSYVFEDIIADARTGNQQHGAAPQTWFQYFHSHGLPQVQGKQYYSIEPPITKFRERLQIPGAFAINNNNCKSLIQCGEEWSFPVDKDTGLILPGSVPRKQFSHGMKAICYLQDHIYGKEDISLSLPDWDTRILPESIAI